MDFVTVRDLRVRPGDTWQRLRDKRELILTSSGRPIALLVDIEDADVEDTLMAVRRARAQLAVSRMRQGAAAGGLVKLGAAEIEAEIARARRERRE